jgi:hypothetical protein
MLAFFNLFMKCFTVIYLIQVIFRVYQTWNEPNDQTCSIPKGESHLSSVAIVTHHQSHTIFEKIIYSFIQVFINQWNSYKILSFQNSPSPTSSPSSSVNLTDPNVLRNAETEDITTTKEINDESNQHIIKVTDEIKYLMIGYHSRSTIDFLYFASSFPSSIFVIHILFYLPGFKYLFPFFGLLPARDVKRNSSYHSNSEYFLQTILSSNRPIILIPGGATECLKDFSNLYHLQWKKEMGFTRILRNYYLNVDLNDHSSAAASSSSSSSSSTPPASSADASSLSSSPIPSSHHPEHASDVQSSPKDSLPSLVSSPTKEKEEKKKTIIKIIPFYTSHCEYLFYTSPTWYTMMGRSAKWLMSVLETNYFLFISLLPIIFITIQLSMGFFFLTLPLQTTTYFGKEITFHPMIDTSTETFTERIKDHLEDLMKKVNSLDNEGEGEEGEEEGEDVRTQVVGKADDATKKILLSDKISRKKESKMFPLIHDLLKNYSSFSLHSFCYNVYLLCFGFYMLILMIALNLFGISCLIFIFVLLLALTPFLVMLSPIFKKKVKKQKIS